jgi:hypothetical protein
MNPYQAIRVLNDLLAVLRRSLSAYLADAKPWTCDDDEQLCSMLHHLTADQARYAERVEEAIIACGGRPDPGHFPDGYEAKNDLAIDYLKPEIVVGLEQSLLVIERCAVQLEGEAALHALAEEVLGNAKGHLDLLQGIVKATS